MMSFLETNWPLLALLALFLVVEVLIFAPCLRPRSGKKGPAPDAAPETDSEVAKRIVNIIRKCEMPCFYGSRSDYDSVTVWRRYTGTQVSVSNIDVTGNLSSGDLALIVAEDARRASGKVNESLGL
jgi:hypothetical protein